MTTHNTQQQYTHYCINHKQSAARANAPNKAAVAHSNARKGASALDKGLGRRGEWVTYGKIVVSQDAGLWARRGEK